MAVFLPANDDINERAQLTILFEEPLQRALFCILEQEVQILFVLESGFELDDVGVAAELLAYVAFSEDRLDLVVFDDVVFHEHF